jgi:hypothetical protein
MADGTKATRFDRHPDRSSLINQVPPNMLSAMVTNPIARRLAALVLVLTLIVGGAPMAMAAAGMDDCGMAMGSTAMQASMTQDQPGKPMPHQMPCKDMGGICMATCSGGVSLPHIASLPALSSKPAVLDWAVQGELPGILSRPDIPPPIAIL